MKKKKFRVNDYQSIDDCLNQMESEGYRPIKRIEKPVFEEQQSGEAEPVEQEIVFQAVKDE
ncbi:NETI motif-containing protein [Alkalibacillus sp. S2W]|uniref:NETI motif-containing protein n=1 Tax=Alkalibacillus sp. S2W TaxID=3386553 RepID=UPI00398D4225